MNRLLWGIAFLVLAAAGGWAQSTWRGQAEVWSAATAPADGFVVASNEFPRNTLLTVENYKSKKTIQVRVVAALPAGSSALVLLNAKAAQALDIKAGDAPMVGVRIDPTGIDLADNPDPDVNPLAAKPAAVAVAPVPAPVVPAVAPPTVPAETPKVPTPAATPAAPDSGLLPLPALANPEPVPEPSTPLTVTEEPETPAPVTPGKKVFLTTRESEPVAAETPAVTEPAETPAAPATPEATPAETTPEPAPEATPPAVATPAPVVTPEAAPAPEPTPAPAPAAVAAPVETKPETPAPAVAAAPVPASPVPVKPSSAWVDVPGKLEGPILGQVAVLTGLEKGRAYVQVGAWASEADLMKALGSVKSYVPLALYWVDGEKNPWRVIATAPKGQLGILLAQFKSQGFRTAAVVKG